MLFHGVTCSARVWRQVIAHLEPHYEVIAPTALGHRGGTEIRGRPVRMADVIDDAERCLDGLGIGRAHLAGNSMGGWIALELARRGRARSVCALSPAGLWQADGKEAGRKLERLLALARATRPLLTWGSRFAAFRRHAMRDNAKHGGAMTRADFIAMIDDAIGCEAAADLLSTRESLPELSVDCPVTLAWSEDDRIFPLNEYASLARARVPHAHFMALAGVGHVPMLDDPGLVADTIRTAAGRRREDAQATNAPGARVASARAAQR